VYDVFDGKQGNTVTTPVPFDEVACAIQEWTHINLQAWENAAEEYPSDLPQFSHRQQDDNKRHVELLLKKASEELSRRHIPDPLQRQLLSKRARYAVTAYLLQLKDPAVNLFLEECEGVAEAFARTAMDFDSSMLAVDVFQALRNQWVFNSIQWYLGVPVSVTPSSFAYSMLYPYTDNSIDDGNPTGEQIRSFLDWLSRRLRGSMAGMQDSFRSKVGRLIEKIELQYPRSEYPQVRESLLAIHAAQEKSMSLRSSVGEQTEGQLLSVTIEKGGTSVLADGYLVSGNLSRSMAEVMFAYGVLLQLIDDLEDLDEDSAAGCSTPFSRALECRTLEASTNRLFAYMQWCLRLIRVNADGHAPSMSELIGRSCTLLMLEAIAHNNASYSQEYLDYMQQFMPLPLDYFASMHQRAKEGIRTATGVHENPGSVTLEQVFEIVVPQSSNEYRTSGEPHYAA
jgi:hypothetical protein